MLVKITKEEHDKWLKMPKSQAEREFLDKYDRGGAWECGYGVYGFDISETENEVFLEIGDSCD